MEREAEVGASAMDAATRLNRRFQLAGAPDLLGLEQGLLIHQFDKQNGGINKHSPDEPWW